MASFEETMKLGQQQLDLALEVVQIEPHVWQAPSPDHAAAWLRIFADIPSSQIPGERDPSKFLVRPGYRLFYRGQSNIDWKPTPTLYRKPASARAIPELATKVMAAVVDHIYAEAWKSPGAADWPPLTKSAGLAAARHYELDTTLLDWTVNPQIALYFATKDLKPEDKPATGAVYWIEDETAEAYGLNVVLAPPVLRRLHLQRGFFTDLQENQIDPLSKAGCRIEFPNHPKQQVQGINTNDLTLFDVDVYPEDAWLKTLADWSKAKVPTMVGQVIDGVALAKGFVASHGPYPVLDEFLEDGIETAQWMAVDTKNFIDQLTWLHGKGGRTCHSSRMMRVLRATNQPFFDWAAKYEVTFPECE